MRGNCEHVVFSTKDTVELCNNDDSFYVQIFETRQECERFITKFRTEMNKAFPGRLIMSSDAKGRDAIIFEE